MQYHYVVVYDSETEQWCIDGYTTMLRFPDSVFYDTQQDEWIDESNEDYEIHDEIYTSVGLELSKALQAISNNQEVN